MEDDPGEERVVSNYKDACHISLLQKRRGEKSTEIDRQRYKETQRVTETDRQI